MAAKTAYTDVGDYSTATDADLGAIEPSLGYVVNTANSTDANTVSVLVSGTNDEIWGGAALSDSGQCFFIQDTASGPVTEYGEAAGPACAADDMPATLDPSW